MSKTLGQYTADDLAGLQIDLMSKLRKGNLLYEEIKWFNNLSDTERSFLFKKHARSRSVLKLITKAMDLTISATDERKICNTGMDVFAYIYDKFTDHSHSYEPTKTKPMVVDVYNLIEEATYTEIYSYFYRDLNSLCLTQSQIISFTETHKTLPSDYARQIHFLYRADNQFFVAFIDRIDENKGMPRIFQRPLGDTLTWMGKSQDQFVIPRFTTV